MNLPRHISRILLVFCLLGIFGVIKLDEAEQPVALAQAPHAESAEGSVERWTGTIIDDLSNNYGAEDCPGWACVGDSHWTQLQEWNLEVQEDGTVNGQIKTEMIAYSYRQTRTNNTCGPLAGNPSYHILGCVFAVTLTQPHGRVLVQGKREINPTTQRPQLIITEATWVQDCETFWTARGTHSVSGAMIHKQATTDCNRWSTVPKTLNITTYEDGRAPQILLNHSSNSGGISYTRSGHLTGTTEEPLLELDREFLERSIFLDQIPLEEMFVAKMNWNSPHGGWVSWKLSATDSERVGPSTASELSKPVNTGMQGVGVKQLTVQAHTTLNRTSRPQITQITVVPPPGWAGAPTEISATKIDGVVAYRNSIRFPNPPFEGVVTVPAVVPWLGGKQFGLTKTQGALTWEAKSSSEGQGALFGQTGLTAMGDNVLGTLTGRARVVLDPSGVKIPEGGMDFGIAGQIRSQPEPLLNVVPSLRPALLTIEKISPQAANFINERAQARLELAPKLDFGFTFFTQDDEIKFKNAQAKPGFAFKTMVEIKLIKDVLQAIVSIGGAISATFQVPEPYFKEAALQGLVQAQITLYRWAYRGERMWSVVLSNSSATIANADQLWEYASGSETWEPLARNYLDMPNYARWLGDSPSGQNISATGDDIALVENVFPLANPSLHVSTNEAGVTRMVQAWAHDKVGTPAHAAGEIVFSTNFGTEWQTPTFLTDDNQDDLSPKAVILSSGHTLVLWQRMDTNAPPNFDDDPAGYLSHWQVAAQRVDSNDPLQQLSTSGSLNYRHQLGATDDGAIAIWVNNPANQLMGDAANPDTIFFAHYTIQDDTWSVAAPVLSDMSGLVSLDLATNGQHAAIVYAVDTNSDIATAADQELFYLTWNGTTWSAPSRLTDNNVADESPALALDSSGLPLLVWRQDGTLKFLQGGWQNAPTDLPLANAAERADYDLAQSSDGHLVLFWQDVGAEETRIGYALFDATHNHWSDQRTLALPLGAEGSMATSIVAALLPADGDQAADHGALVFGYLLAHVESITQTVDGVPIPNVPEIVQHDVRVATQPLRINLTVTPHDLSIPASDKIQAVIHNTGELVANNVPVALHIGPGDPVSGETQMLAQTIPLIVAGSTATVTFTVADHNETYFMVEIDPEHTLAESDTDDNTAVLGTDVAITTLPAYYSPLGTNVRALVNQQGNRYVSVLASASLSVDSPNGPVIGGTQFAFPLAPTEAITLSAFISTTQLGQGRHQLYWTLDPDGSLGEDDRSNNVAATSIMILPDLAIAGDMIYFGAAPGNTSHVQIGVQNLGNWANNESIVEFFDGLPGEAGTHSLGRLLVPTIQPGSSVEISDTLQLAGLPAATSGLSSIYVQLDPDGKIEESNENNNLAAAGAVLEGTINEQDSFPLYLPSIER